MKGITATISVTAFRADWLTHIPMRALCERWTVTRDQVIRLKHVWQLPPRHDRRLRAKPIRQPDPTPTQIKAACIRIQSQWTDDVRQDRRVTKVQPVTLQRIELTDDAKQAMTEPENDGPVWEVDR